MVVNMTVDHRLAIRKDMTMNIALAMAVALIFAVVLVVAVIFHVVLAVIFAEVVLVAVILSVVLAVAEILPVVLAVAVNRVELSVAKVKVFFILEVIVFSVVIAVVLIVSVVEYSVHKAIVKAMVMTLVVAFLIFIFLCAMVLTIIVARNGWGDIKQVLLSEATIVDQGIEIESMLGRVFVSFFFFCRNLFFLVVSVKPTEEFLVVQKAYVDALIVFKRAEVVVVGKL